MKPVIRHACLLLTFFLVLMGQAFAETQPLRVGWVLAMANAPVVVADKKGLFKAEGLDVKIIQFASGPLLNQALAAGEIELAYVGTPPVYHWFSRGLESKILAKVNYGQEAVIARKDSGINTIADLKGKKMAGVRKGSGADVLLRGYVLGEVGKIEGDKDVAIVQMPTANMPPSVEEKVVDAAYIWEPFTSQSLARGNTKIVLDLNTSLPQHPWYVVIAPPKALAERRADIVKALRAHKKAVDFLNSSPTAGNDIIAEEFKLRAVTDASGKEHTPADIVADARTRLGWAYEITDKDKEFVQRLMGYSLALGFIKSPMKPDDLIDTSYMQEIIKADAAIKKPATPKNAQAPKKQASAKRVTNKKQ
jgi:NitT/TauT family transport system substrate-binding protein